jgi:hypothetical protein
MAALSDRSTSCLISTERNLLLSNARLYRLKMMCELLQKYACFYLYMGVPLGSSTSNNHPGGSALSGITLAVGVLSAELPCRVLHDTVNLRPAANSEASVSAVHRT